MFFPFSNDKKKQNSTFQKSSSSLWKDQRLFTIVFKDTHSVIKHLHDQPQVTGVSKRTYVPCQQTPASCCTWWLVQKSHRSQWVISCEFCIISDLFLRIRQANETINHSVAFQSRDLIQFFSLTVRDIYKWTDCPWTFLQKKYMLNFAESCGLFGFFGDLNHIIITTNDTAAPRDSKASKFWNETGPISWLVSCPKLWTTLASSQLKGIDLKMDQSHQVSLFFFLNISNPNCRHLSFLPAAEPVDLSMCWKAHVTPFAPCLYICILLSWQVLGR